MLTFTFFYLFIKQRGKDRFYTWLFCRQLSSSAATQQTDLLQQPLLTMHAQPNLLIQCSYSSQGKHHPSYCWPTARHLQFALL